MVCSKSSPRSLFRIGQRLLLLSLAIAALATIFSFAQGKGDCPPIIASILPKNGAIRGGAFNRAGDMGMGNGAADLPFDHPCTKSDKYPARISVAITYYGGQMAQLLQMQGDAANQQTLDNAMRELQRGQGSVRREKLPGGEIVYVSYETPCQPETIDTGKLTTYPPTPHVKLKGVALTASARMEVDLEGRITLDLAKAAVSEAMDNFKKADFGKTP